MSWRRFECVPKPRTVTCILWFSSVIPIFCSDGGHAETAPSRSHAPDGFAPAHIEFGCCRPNPSHLRAFSSITGAVAVRLCWIVLAVKRRSNTKEISGKRFSNRRHTRCADGQTDDAGGQPADSCNRHPAVISSKSNHLQQCWSSGPDCPYRNPPR